MNDSIIYEPRTGTEVSNAVAGAPVYVYSELVREAERVGPVQMLINMMQRSLDNFILVQNPNKMNSGHWTALKFKPFTKEIYFFSTYGGKPDTEKNLWISPNDLIRSHQVPNIINDGLKVFALNGWKIHYNQHEYQHKGDKTATCGIWSAAFLNDGENPDQFYRRTKRQRLSAEDYYNFYFS